MVVFLQMSSKVHAQNSKPVLNFLLVDFGEGSCSSCYDRGKTKSNPSLDLPKGFDKKDSCPAPRRTNSNSPTVSPFFVPDAWPDPSDCVACRPDIFHPSKETLTGRIGPCETVCSISWFAMMDMNFPKFRHFWIMMPPLMKILLKVNWKLKCSKYKRFRDVQQECEGAIF